MGERIVIHGGNVCFHMLGRATDGRVEFRERQRFGANGKVEYEEVAHVFVLQPAEIFL